MGLLSAGAQALTASGGEAALDGMNTKNEAEQIGEEIKAAKTAHDSAMLNMKGNEAQSIAGIKYG